MSQKHVDFVLCDREQFWPLLVIELDDRSHARIDRIRSDRVKDEVLRSAGIPLLRIACQEAYDVQDLAEKIARLLVADNHRGAMRSASKADRDTI